MMHSPNSTHYANLYFSILIPTWNNLTFLQCCVRSILKNSSLSHQIIVHVNEGSDGTCEWLDNMQIAYTHSKQNIGICSAMNQIAKLAESDYLVFMNDDMYALPGWDVELIRVVQTLPDNAFYLSSTLIEPAHTNNQCVIAPHDFGRNPDEFQEEKLLKEYATLPWHDWYGATWPPSLVHRSMWNLVGGYSEAFSPGLYSDPDFSMKLWQSGVRVFRGVQSSRVYHFMSKTTHRIPMNNGRKQFAQKWKMTARYFTHYILKIGQPFNGKPLHGPSRIKAPLWQRLRARWVR